MQMAFYTGSQFPEDYRGDAFVAMHGSWNRTPPSGYQVVRIRFKDGKPQSIEPFMTGFLAETGEDEWGYLGRPFGIAVANDGSLLVGDSSNGMICRVSHEAKTAEAASKEGGAMPAKNAALKEQDTPQELAGKILPTSKSGKLDVTSAAFKSGERLDLRYSAYGEDISPELSWSKGPEGTKSYVLLTYSMSRPM